MLGCSKQLDTKLIIVLFICLFLMMTGCGSGNIKESGYSSGKKYPLSGKSYVVNGARYHTLASAHGYSETGVASWYGKKFHGRKTSSGERYDMYDMTAAHKILPLGTVVKVTNLDNKREITVRINDRGPFYKDRIIDLSYAGAHKLGIVGPGTGVVLVEALGSPQKKKIDGKVETVLVQPRSYQEGRFSIQVASFRDKSSAEKLAMKLRREYGVATIEAFDRGDAVFYRVQVADAGTIGQAVAIQTKLESNGYRDCFVVSR